jgi:hypothetical protein
VKPANPSSYGISLSGDPSRLAIGKVTENGRDPRD